MALGQPGSNSRATRPNYNICSLYVFELQSKTINGRENTKLVAASSFSGFMVLATMWIFGYGSLVWKADFPYAHRLTGYIKGYVRRFWQSSVDHRGVPDCPGRVVTILPSSDPDAEVWGVAYEIAKEDEESVTKHLDYREKDGYKKVTATFFPFEADMNSNKKSHDCSECLPLPSEPFNLVIYIGTEDNAYFAGEADIEDIAQQVINSVGPSGTNKEYVYNLAAAMRRLAPGVVDDHLFALETAVRRLDNEQSSHTLA